MSASSLATSEPDGASDQARHVPSAAASRSRATCAAGGRPDSSPA